MKSINIVFSLLLMSSLSYASKLPKDLESFLFSKPDKGVVTEAFVLSHNGKIINERYETGNSSTRHLLWSMTKSVGSILFGIAQDRGYVNLDDSIYKYYKKEIDLQSKKRVKALSKIKIRHLLGMSSGLAWNEFYEEDPFNSHVVRMLYFESKKSVVNYVLKTPTRFDPGKRFYYSSGDSNLISGILKRALPSKLQKSYPWEFLFDPLEMNATYEVDAQNVFMASSYLYLTTYDLLKLGRFIINGGRYKGQQIVSKEYLDYAVKLNTPMRKYSRCLVDSHMTYGAQFWLNHPCENGKRPFKDAPADMIMLLGHGGQSVFIFPTQNIVAVRIARDDQKALNKNKYAKLILNLIEEKSHD